MRPKLSARVLNVAMPLSFLGLVTVVSYDFVSEQLGPLLIAKSIGLSLGALLLTMLIFAIVGALKKVPTSFE